MTISVAIVGRPNVGKSTLFNRLVGRRLALVDDTPGVTRDRRVAPARLGALLLLAIDTAGLEDAPQASLAGRMRAQTETAIGEADLVLFLIDARDGVIPADEEFVRLVRRSGKPFVLVANKAEANAARAGLGEAAKLGLGEPVAISAEHGLGMSDLHDAIVEAVGRERAYGGEADAAPAAGNPVAIAVLGRPNAGKSTLVNRLIGEDRMLTGPEAGITRDSIAVDWTWRGRPVRLFDTAGLRKKANVTGKLEKLSVADGLRAMQFAEVAIVVVDALAPFEKQDLQIADLVIREGRAPVIALNKWDLVEDRQQALRDRLEEAARLLPQVKGLRVIPVSGKTGEGIDRLMAGVFQAYDAWNRRVPTARLNRWLERAMQDNPPPAVSGRRVRIKYVTQVKSRPPTFAAACSRPDALPDSYVRYLVNSLSGEFGLEATPVRFLLRKGENPFAGRSARRD
jgi:GTP-binding protein